MKKLFSRPIYWIAIAAGCAPLAWYLFRFYAPDSLLSAFSTKRVSLAREVEVIVRYFGWFGAFFLLASLACTPLRLLFGWSWAASLRKPLGLFGFFYAAAHLYTYVFYQEAFDLRNLWARDEDLDRNLYGTIFGEALKFPFQLVGMAAFILLVPLALTSTNWALRKMGGKNWQRLHKLVYPITILVAIHYIMAIKSPVKTKGIIFASILALLLGVRVYKWLERKRKTAAK
jgi:sulfoxide reductase heme-binding subunit YedZ